MLSKKNKFIIGFSSLFVVMIFLIGFKNGLEPQKTGSVSNKFEDDFITSKKKEDGSGNRNVLIIIDGLRPDYVTPELMPNAYQMGQRGVIGEQSYAVFPSVTRPNRTSIVTGSYPSKHGIIHNTLFHSELDLRINTAILDQMNQFEEVSGSPMVTSLSLGELLAQKGDRLLAIGDTYGSWLLNHRAKGKGWQLPEDFRPETARAEIYDTVGEAPPRGRINELASWAVDVYLHDALGDDPAEVVLIWPAGVDAAAHANGVGAPEVIDIVTHLDTEIGRVLDIHEEYGLTDKVNIFITSDHGFSQSIGGFSTANVIEEIGLEEYVDVVGNMLFVKSSQMEHKESIVEALHRNESVGAIYSQPANTGDIKGQVQGTLSTDIIHWTHERSSDIIVSPAWNDEKNEYGWKGTSTFGGTGSHGSDSPFDLHIPLLAFGPDIKTGVRSSVPTGNIDFAPTILHLRRIVPPDHMDGRVLHELLNGGPDPDSIDVQKYNHQTSIAYPDGFHYQTKMELLRVGSTSYLQGAHTVRKVLADE